MPRLCGLFVFFRFDIRIQNFIVRILRRRRQHGWNLESHAKLQINATNMISKLDENMFREIIGNYVTGENLNKFGRFDELKATVDKEKAIARFEAKGERVAPRKIPVKIDSFPRDFIERGEFDSN